MRTSPEQRVEIASRALTIYLGEVLQRGVSLPSTDAFEHAVQIALLDMQDKFEVGDDNKNHNAQAITLEIVEVLLRGYRGLSLKSLNIILNEVKNRVEGNFKNDE